MAATFRDYLNKTGTLPDDVTLGHIVYFTITDEHIPEADLLQSFVVNGLDTQLLPPPLKAIDAFKKATSEVKINYPLDDGSTAYLICRDVGATHEAVARQITREVKDSRARRLSYDRAIECVFYRGTTNSTGRRVPGSERLRLTVDTTHLRTEELATVRNVAREIELAYTAYSTCVDGNKLRAVVRNYIKHLNGIELRGGVYFVHANRAAELVTLQAFTNGLGGGCSMKRIPLVDLEEQRDMVIEAYKREAEQRLSEIVNKITELRTNYKQITPAAYANLHDEFLQIKKESEEYVTTLNMSTTITQAAEQAAEQALVDLQMRFIQQGGQA